MNDSQKPIPAIVNAATAGSYKDEPFDAENHDASEPLVKLADYGIAGESYYFRQDGGNIPFHIQLKGSLPQNWARKGIAEKLVKVNQYLKSENLEVFVLDSYRPITCQTSAWNFFIEKFSHENPHWSPERVREETLMYWSDPTAFVVDNPKTWPTHSTGAAVDLTLRDCNSGDLLDMGTHFDDARPIAHTCYYEDLAAKGEIAPTDQRLLNRRKLYHAMCSVGFVNYPYEFWHYDYGNQMHRYNLRQKGEVPPPTAIYGYIELPKNEIGYAAISED